MPYHKQTPKMKKKNENLPKTEIENLIPFYFLSFSCNPNAHKHRRSTKDRLCVFGIVKLKIQRCQFLASVLTTVPNPLQATESVE